MTKTELKKSITIAFAIVFLASGAGILATSSAYAHDGPRVLPGSTEDDSTKKDTTVKEDKQKVGQRGKLNESRLKLCQAKEANINKTLAKIAANGERHIAKISKSSERAQAYYQSNGLSVSNYAELLAAVNSKKAAAEAAVAAVKSSSVNFKCGSSDPQGAGLTFKENLRKEKIALKEYKAAVKSLIRAVKVAADNSQGGN